jgi:hypothetical protein
MEAYAIYVAASEARQPKPLPICAKAVVDGANMRKNDAHRKLASARSAAFLLAVLERWFAGAIEPAG